ncbi:MAG TPA: porin family protein [Saprospiraceae bacterium]|nr:porin family protein [Saprospiraceae bacterium]
MGVRISTNIASFNISEDLSEDEDLNYKMGFGLGLYYKVALDENLSFQPEINYVQQGAKSSGEVIGLSYKNVFKFNYIQIPILAKYQFGDQNRVNFFVEGGPYVGFGIGKGKIESCLDGECDVEELSFGNTDDNDIKNPDFGIQLGGGIIVNSKFSIDIRYVYGIQNLIIDSDEDDFLRNTAFNIGVGYSF